MGVVQFVRNYSDQSTDTGFQFEFYCDKCGTGYQTRVTPASSNVMPDLLNAAGSMFGGVFSAASQMTEHARSAAWQKEKDAAFLKAVDEIKPQFKQCGQCRSWADEACWDKKAGQCTECAETVQDEESDAETQSDQETITCPSCDAEVKKSKFCAECGKPLLRTCTCGATVTGGKFCPECGKKLGGKK